MILCVGAASRRVIEEAAKLRVHQIVASRRQVGEFSPGYTGLDSVSLVSVVRELSSNETNVVRDHGGPYQNGNPDDDWERALLQDLAAGFHVLHLDVCHLPKGAQGEELRRLCKRLGSHAYIEVGGERDSQPWLDYLLGAAQTECKVSVAVADLGGHVWADRQRGHLKPLDRCQEIVSANSARGVVTKAHNLDWAGARTDYTRVAALYNVAPEFGNVEVDAWLRTLSGDDARVLLSWGYDSRHWERWFKSHEGTRFERARCALRYLLEDREVRLVLDEYDDTEVREAIRDALQRG